MVDPRLPRTVHHPGHSGTHLGTRILVLNNDTRKYCSNLPHPIAQQRARARTLEAEVTAPRGVIE